MNLTNRSYTVDPHLNALAAGLENIEFNLSNEEIELFSEREQQNLLQNVSKFRDGLTYRVRFYLGGKQRVIGMTKNGAAAALFADCARLYFWPYRLRGGAPPVETDFNFDQALARATLEHHESVAPFLEKIREHLSSFGDLRERNVEEDADSEKRGQLKRQRLTLRHLLEQTIREKDAEIASTRLALTNLTEDNKHNFAQLKTAFHHILERLTALEENAKQKDS